MKIYELTGLLTSEEGLLAQYKAAKEIAGLYLSENNLFFRKKLKCYRMPKEHVDRYFRRVNTVPARMCCAGGDLMFHSIVLCHNGEEAAEIPMPDEKAALLVMKALKEYLPDVLSVK